MHVGMTSVTCVWMDLFRPPLLCSVMSQEALSHSWFHQSARRKSSMGGSRSRRLSASAPSIQTLGQTGIGNSMLQRLRSFAKMTSFQQEVMRVAVKKLDDLLTILLE